MDHLAQDFATPAEALSWLIDMGADEIILDAAIDRFAQSALPKEEIAKPLLTPFARQTETLAPKPTAPKIVAATGLNSLAEISQALNFFETHPLRKTSSKLSFIEGAAQADILIISDRPRNEEDKSGLVIAGKSRLLLTNMLAAINVNLDDVALMNLVPWRPPGNRAPTENEVTTVLPFILRAIELIKPKAILAFSALPARYLAGSDETLPRQRGKWLSAHGIDLISTFHPEELLKFAAHKKIAWRDLQSFRDKINE